MLTTLVFAVACAGAAPIVVNFKSSIKKSTSNGWERRSLSMPIPPVRITSVFGIDDADLGFLSMAT